MGDWATLRELCRHRTYHYNLIVPSDDKVDLGRIHPFKQKAVHSLLEYARSFSGLEELWLFGSSLQPYCKYTSDIDLAYRVSEQLRYTLEEDELREQLTSFDINGVDLVDLYTIHEYSPLAVNIRKGLRLL